MEQETCPHCAGWEIAPAEAICGACGGILRPYKFEWRTAADKNTCTIMVRRGDLVALSALRVIAVTATQGNQTGRDVSIAGHWPAFSDWWSVADDTPNASLEGMTPEIDSEGFFGISIDLPSKFRGRVHIQRYGGANTGVNDLPPLGLIGDLEPIAFPLTATSETLFGGLRVHVPPQHNGCAVAQADLILDDGERLFARAMGTQAANFPIAAVAPGRGMWLRFPVSPSTEIPGEAELSLRTTSYADQVAGRIFLRRCDPAKPMLRISRNAPALRGSFARIAVGVFNTGGDTVTVKAIRWRENAGAWTLLSVLDVFESDTSTAGVPVLGELRPKPSSTFGQCHLEFEIDVLTAFDIVTLRAAVEVPIVEPAPYNGLVCIDFGTTQTAAAFRSFGVVGDHDPLSAAALPATPIELKRLTINDRPDTAVPGETFLTTAIAASVSPDGKTEYFYGDHAERVGRARGSAVLLVQDLKWVLAQPHRFTLSNGTVLTTRDLAVEYLKHVHDLIEAHPEITATLDEVYITKPSVFGGEDEKALVEVFKKAGFTVMEMLTANSDISQAGNEQPARHDEQASDEPAAADAEADDRRLICESWPPLLWLIPAEALSKGATTPLKNLANPTPLAGRGLTGSRIDRGSLVITFDVGGGSTDISAFHIDRPESALRIVEYRAATSRSYAGRAFDTMILGALSRVFARKLGASAADEAEFLRRRGIVIPTTLVMGQSEGAFARNQDALRPLALAIKDRFGPLSVLGQALGKNILSFAAQEAAAGKPVVNYIGEVRKRSTEALDALGALSSAAREGSGSIGDSLYKPDDVRVYDRFVAFYGRSLTLLGEQGQSIPVPIDREVLKDALVETIMALALEAGHVTELFRRVVGELKPKPENCLVLVSGRGALFVPAFQLIGAVVKVLLDVDFISIMAGQSGQDGKTITSLGGLLLPDIVETTGLSFAARIQEALVLSAPSGMDETVEARLSPAIRKPDEWAIANLGAFKPSARIRLLLRNEEGKVARELARLPAMAPGKTKWVAVQFDEKLALKALVRIDAATAVDALAAAIAGQGVSLLKTKG